MITALPNEIVLRIADYFCGHCYVSKKDLAPVAALSQTCRSINRIVQNVLDDFLKSYYQRKYKYATNLDGALLDAVCTASTLPYFDRTFKEYSDEIGEDIKKIVKLSPHSLQSKIGNTRTESGAQVFAMACYNLEMPLPIIEFLIQHGGGNCFPCRSNERHAPIIRRENFLAHLSNPERAEAIRKLLNQYDVSILESIRNLYT